MRIAMSGTQSVGKSSLVKELKKLPQFTKYKFYTERSTYLASMGVPLNNSSTFHGQLLFMAERARELMENNMITDRSSVDVASFTESSDLIDSKKKIGLGYLLMELAREYDIIFYIPPVIRMEKNGVRETNLMYRRVIDEGITRLLSNPMLEKKVHVIQSRTLKTRVQEVLEVIRKKKLVNNEHRR